MCHTHTAQGLIQCPNLLRLPIVRAIHRPPPKRKRSQNNHNNINLVRLIATYYDLRLVVLLFFGATFPSSPSSPTHPPPPRDLASSHSINQSINQHPPMHTHFAWSQSPQFAPQNLLLIFTSNNRDGYLSPCSLLTYPSASTPPSQAEKVKLR